jgi:hypothetical protein
MRSIGRRLERIETCIERHDDDKNKSLPTFTEEWQDEILLSDDNDWQNSIALGDDIHLDFNEDYDPIIIGEAY